jgi:hypothetical protein
MIFSDWFDFFWLFVLDIFINTLEKKAYMYTSNAEEDFFVVVLLCMFWNLKKNKSIRFSVCKKCEVRRLLTKSIFREKELSYSGFLMKNPDNYCEILRTLILKEKN